MMSDTIDRTRCLRRPIGKGLYMIGCALESELAEARAQIAASEQEHQDFRLQNDAEWRAKLDHLKAQIAAKDAALREIRFWLEKDDEAHTRLAFIDAALATPARETE